MADADIESGWKKSKQIETERMKAAHDLEKRAKDKSGLAYLPVTKVHGFSRDPNVIMKNAERMANISIIFALLGIVFGIFMQLFAIVAEVNKLGLAGSGIAMIIGAVYGIGIGVAVITGIVALVCMIIFARYTKYKVKPIIITAGISLALVAIYFIVLNMIS